ncbi:hypothetical protein KXV85_002872, partial [Aspergillus fumigatus]
MFSSRLLAASALAAIVAACPRHAETAPAADAAAGDAAMDDGLETITVPAQKRKEDLQTTPISISVLSAAGLENRHVTSLLDLGDGAIPSLK